MSGELARREVPLANFAELHYFILHVRDPCLLTRSKCSPAPATAAKCVAFLREAYRPKGGPSGGNGGRGGSVILQADHDLNNLLNQFFQPQLVAEQGEGGKGKCMNGLAGKDLIVKVPCGTLVWRLPAPRT